LQPSVVMTNVPITGLRYSTVKSHHAFEGYKSQ